MVGGGYGEAYLFYGPISGAHTGLTADVLMTGEYPGGVTALTSSIIGDANSDLRMAQQAGVPVVIGYGAGWSTPPPLDPCFPCLSHWRELEVRTTSA